MQKFFLTAVIMVVILIFSVVLYSCHGSNNSTVIIPSSGKIGVFFTNGSSSDPSLLTQVTPTNLSPFSQITTTIDSVEIHDSGTLNCDLLTVPVILDIANLSNMMQLVNVSQCTAGSFNRIRLTFDKNVELMSGPTGTSFSCSFTSFKEQGNQKQPDVLHCDDTTNICTLEINGAVHVLTHQNNKLALDFSLKDFDITGIGTPACAVTMKVSPLNASDMKGRGNSEAITGFISDLNITDRTFDLTRGNHTFSVLYSGVSTTDQPGLDTLLQRAQDDHLRAMIRSSDIDFINNTIDAQVIFVKVEGTVSDLVAGATFIVNYADGTKQIAVDFTNATVEGNLVNGAWVDVKLKGFSVPNNDFIAEKVEVETPGMIIED